VHYLPRTSSQKKLPRTKQTTNVFKFKSDLRAFDFLQISPFCYSAISLFTEKYMQCIDFSFLLAFFEGPIKTMKSGNDRAQSAECINTIYVCKFCVFPFPFLLLFPDQPFWLFGDDNWKRGTSHKANKLLTQHMNDNISVVEPAS